MMRVRNFCNPRSQDLNLLIAYNFIVTFVEKNKIDYIWQLTKFDKTSLLYIYIPF